MDHAAVEDITIYYQYSGWEFYEEHFRILPDVTGSGFLMRGDYVDAGGRKRSMQRAVSEDDVASLLQAAAGLRWDREKGIRALATRISPSAITALEPISTIPPIRCTLAQRRKMAMQRVRSVGLPALVDEQYGQRGLSWTDDYPFAVLSLKLKGQQPVVIHSNSQKAMMLPWQHGEPEEAALPDIEDWSLPLSQALRGLLPENSKLHDRLGGQSLPVRLKYSLDHKVTRECGIQTKLHVRSQVRISPR